MTAQRNEWHDVQLLSNKSRPVPGGRIASRLIFPDCPVEDVALAAEVGAAVTAAVGLEVAVGALVGAVVGATVGVLVGAVVGDACGAIAVGALVGAVVGATVGAVVGGACVGIAVGGTAVGTDVAGARVGCGKAVGLETTGVAAGAEHEVTISVVAMIRQTDQQHRLFIHFLRMRRLNIETSGEESMCIPPEQKSAAELVPALYH
jgi:hypothetical protein